MKKRNIGFIFIVGIMLLVLSCKKNNPEVHTHDDSSKDIAIDTTKFTAFFNKYPEFKNYEGEIRKLYQKHNHYIWHEKRGFIESAEIIYDKVNQLDEEGLQRKVPYKNKIDALFTRKGRREKPNVDSELLLSAMYFYYTDKVLDGIDTSKSKQTGWYLPRERVDYVAYLDTLMQEPKLLKDGTEKLFSEYYNLKKGLKKYREIKNKGGWGKIELPENVKSLQKGDSAQAVVQLRARLAAEGYFKGNTTSNVFDDDLYKAVDNYEKSHYSEFDGKVGPQIIGELNIPVEERIKTISLNMERCRWISPDIDTLDEYIAVNIPSYRLRYVHDGDIKLISNVVVGKELNKTVVFSGQMSYIVFSPYWNVPESILEKEIKPGIAKNSNYLAQHNMEWYNNGKSVRQKPGGNNSLGKVKFMFPNSNNIYLHDTPAKSLFNRNDRAFSHGCVRVQKAKELALAITKEQKGWNEGEVDKAMNASTEQYFNLEKKIPVYITYFTAWADEDGNVAFFDDIYERDNSLANLLYKN
ncbi:L,D-transpeptidase family protein [Flavobacterium rhizosphaerae]|uniref:L,D-transpeptidase family protein n=1 Tax=Flavobacterium rhizosphaerae TaxID=3163298 RepID=A0ABW8YT37_9FLAO